MSEKKRSPRLLLTDWILQNYPNVYLTTGFYKKLDMVYKGELKGQTSPCPPEDLLDMWKQKKNYLDKVAEENRRRGKAMTDLSRVNYDLSILLARHSAYLEWKEKNRRAQSLYKDKEKDEALSKALDSMSDYAPARSRQKELTNLDGVLEEI